MTEIYISIDIGTDGNLINSDNLGTLPEATKVFWNKHYAAKK